MNTSQHLQNFPNPNPNFDQFSNSNFDQVAHNDLLHFHNILSYLMSDEDLEQKVVSGNEDVFGYNTYIQDESSSSVPLACDIKRERVVKKSKEKEECRIAFRTKSVIEFMDDGFKWRKYGKKIVKSSPNPRNYFKCTDGGCNVKKRVERESEDSRYVITTYQGVHNHA